jgi:signal transduction histidine kinase
VEAATSSTILAVENGAPEGELRDSQARLVAAGNAARRRIEQDLHDGAQQRLVALRIHLALAGEQLDDPEQRSMLERLGADVEHALDDLRNLARGVYPALLRDGGLAAALRSLSLDAGLARARPRRLEPSPRRGRGARRVLLLPRGAS